MGLWFVKAVTHYISFSNAVNLCEGQKHPICFDFSIHRSYGLVTPTNAAVGLCTAATTRACHISELPASPELNDKSRARVSSHAIREGPQVAGRASQTISVLEGPKGSRSKLP